MLYSNQHYSVDFTKKKPMLMVEKPLIGAVICSTDAGAMGGRTRIESMPRMVDTAVLESFRSVRAPQAALRNFGRAQSTHLLGKIPRVGVHVALNAESHRQAHGEKEENWLRHLLWKACSSRGHHLFYTRSTLAPPPSKDANKEASPLYCNCI